MAGMIDSKQQKISVGQILTIASENTGDFKKYDKSVVLPAIMTEMNQPNTKVAQFGNTVFIVHQGKDGKGFFKALNADIARNYLDNSYAFLEWAHKELGMKALVTQFKDRTIFNIFKMIGANPPWSGMWYQAYKMKSGDDRIVLGLEPMRGKE